MRVWLVSAGLLALELSGATVTAASAQQAAWPWIAPEILDRTRHLDADELIFCLNSDSAMIEYDRAVGTAIADVLLLKPAFFTVVYPTPAYKYDYRIPITDYQLFTAITNNCDAFLGYRIVANNIPEWMTVSRPYLESRVVLMTTNPAYNQFSDIPPGGKIGVRVGGTGHRELRTYLQALPDGQRPSQIPYPHNELLIERLGDGTLDTIMIWELAPYYATGGDLDTLGIKAIFPAPFPVPPLQFSAGMLKQDTFVRGLIDDAIGELMEAGTLERIAAEYLPKPTDPS